MNRIAVLGSINLDMTVTAQRLPGKGETVHGRELRTVPGGKGANQAVAAARLGGLVTMFGCVGGDTFGETMLGNLTRQGVDTSHVSVIPSETSGLAVIAVADGDNAIIVVPGANGRVTPEYLLSVREELLAHDIVLLQNEIPPETVRLAIELCHKEGKTVIYNPAPARRLDRDLIEMVTYLTPNEHETPIILGESGTACEELAERFSGKLVITVGDQGVLASDAGCVFLTPPIKAHVVDTTGAGDTFNGAFAYALSRGDSFRQAIRLANTAAGISVESFGAQAGMPDLAALNARMK